jgi:hypothetical protein
MVQLSVLQVRGREAGRVSTVFNDLTFLCQLEDRGEPFISVAHWGDLYLHSTLCSFFISPQNTQGVFLPQTVLDLYTSAGLNSVIGTNIKW